MGCKPSKNTNTVHPTNSARHRSRIVHVLESPDGPSSTPEPDDQPPLPFPLHASPLHSTPPPPSLATQLHMKLQDHAKSRQHGRPSLFRQNSLDATTNENIDTQQDLSIGTEPEEDYQVESKQTAILSPQLPGQQFFPSPGHNNQLYNRISAINRLQETDSQIEFFRMLDKRIEQGPDYHNDLLHS